MDESELAESAHKRHTLQVTTHIMINARNYIEGLAARGVHWFRTDDLVATLGCSDGAARSALRRLKAKGQIAEPYRGFQVIIPPEYQRLGCLPAEQFVPPLMKRLGESYYVALLSAAELHSAAHQRPQAFQVMVRKNRRLLECGEVRVQFVARKDVDKTPTVEKKTPRGLLHVASPEATALELVGYAEHCGGLDNVASVLSELAPALDAKLLVAEASRCPAAWVQRLGYLLDLTEHRTLADALTGLVKERAKFLAPLVRSMSRAKIVRNDRWKLAVNVSVEPDL